MIKYDFQDAPPKPDYAAMGVRFEHGNNHLLGYPGPYSGYTICYSKFEEGVVFGISLCSAKDNYVKAKGRDLSLARYTESLEYMQTDDDESFCDGSLVSIVYNRERLQGAFSIGLLRHLMMRDGKLYPDAIKQLTIDDFTDRLIIDSILELFMHCSIWKSETKPFQR